MGPARRVRLYDAESARALTHAVLFVRRPIIRGREGGRGFRTSSSVWRKVYNAIVKEWTNLDGFGENEGCFKIVIEKRMKLKG